MMFEWINSRLSIGARWAIAVACAAPPIALLLFLFVADFSKALEVTNKELAGADYLGDIWSNLMPEGAPPPALRADDRRAVTFQTVAEAKAFAAAPGDKKLATAIVLIRAVGDGSGLTLDTELASYYTMDAATVKLPRLMAAVDAVSRAAGPQDRAFAMGQVVSFTDSAAYDVRQALRHDKSGQARAALARPAANLAGAVEVLRDQTAPDAVAAPAVQRAIDAIWRVNRTELVRMLSERSARLQTQLAVNLSLVTLALGFAVILMVATARGVTGRLRGLLNTMDRLNVGDTRGEVPYQSDTNETGRIATTLEAFKRGLIASVEERRQIEAANIALRESEARYRLLADNVTDVLLRYDLDGYLVYASPSAAQYGYQPEDLVGRRMGDLSHPEDVGMARRWFDEIRQGKLGGRGDWRILTKDGAWVWIEGGPAPLYDDAGALVGVLIVMRNVEDRKAAEQALRERNAELRRVARVSALGAFATSIAHEVNQPLAAVVTNSEASLRWLAKDPVDLENATEAIGRVTRDALRASEVIRSMRALVTKQDLVQADFETNEVITEVLGFVQHERQAVDVAVSVTLSEGASTVHGDRTQFQQLMLNLVLNAIDAIRDVPVEDRRLMIRSTPLVTGDIHIEVEDRGCGIDEATAEQIFEHLFTTKVGGTGLGLAIARSVVEAHGGRIWAEPATPRGAIFKLNLPSANRGREN